MSLEEKGSGFRQTNVEAQCADAQARRSGRDFCAGYSAGPWQIYTVPMKRGYARMVGVPRPPRNDGHAAGYVQVAHVSAMAQPSRVDANARLIAEAPEMFEALQDAIDLIRRVAPLYVGGAEVRRAEAVFGRVIPPAESGVSGRTGSEAYTAEGNAGQDEPPPPQVEGKGP